MEQHCCTTFRLVLGVMHYRGGTSSSVPSLPSKILSTHQKTYFAQSSLKLSAMISPYFSFFWLIHLSKYGAYPRFFGSTYTIPHLEIVAGDAYYRSATSKSIAQWESKRIRSLLAKVKILLSSMTEFMFSTQTASTSPSYTIHLRSSFPSTRS